MNMKMPKHVAIMMDGNGRWGKQRGLTRSEGHYAGTQAMEKVIDGCIDFNIQILTLYAFSSENWARPKDEVNYLMRSEEHTSELQSRGHLVCRLLLEKKKTIKRE